MAIFIDPPRWPAHGTVFSHLISDTSLRELHDFAQAIGVDSRAFDEDHYDVPQEAYDAAVSYGAVEVQGKELIRILRASGLRTAGNVSIRRREERLRHYWHMNIRLNDALCSGLLRRWSEAHRHYHDLSHLERVLMNLEILAQGNHYPISLAVRLAAWYHDAIYEGTPGDEAASVALARQEIADATLAEEVARLILLTRRHVASSTDREGRLLIDADLGILAASADDYQRYVRAVRSEYSRIDERSWRVGRMRVLDTFRSRDAIYLTPWAAENWEKEARLRIEAERSELANS